MMRTAIKSLGIALAVVALHIGSLQGQASASPWILKKHGIAASMNAGVAFAGSEYLPDGTGQDFPLRGRFDSYFLELAGRYGIGWGLEVGLKVLFKGVGYRSDPVLLPGDTNPSSLQDYRDRVFNFSQRSIGLGDIFVNLGYQHLGGAFRLASFLELKVPGGYRAPRETFKEDNPQPSQIGDDVALGDGQVDLMYQLQAGYVVRPTKTLLELDLGYRARFGGPGHQLVGMFKLGQLATKYVLLFASLDGAYTLFDGEVIGTTFTAIDPSQPASEFSGDNVRGLEFSLDRDFLTVAGGAILRFDGPEWVLRVSQVVAGQNYSRLFQVSLGVIMSFG